MNYPQTASERATSLRELAAAGKPVRVRDLISLWGARGRGTALTATVRRELDRLGLSTDPPFEYGSLDNTVSIVPTESRPAPPGPSDHMSMRSDGVSDTNDPTALLHVGQIPSALGGLVSVPETTSVRRAQTLMIRHDYSQLAVVDDEEHLTGVVSWESIALASVHGSVSRVSQCMKAPITLSQDADLLGSIDTITNGGYVIVVDLAQNPTGIITTADLAAQFDRLARPFLTVAQCERELRVVLDSHFSPAELDKATRYRKEDKPGASAMTVGDMKSFVKKPETWQKLGFELSHTAFVDWLEVLRAARNDIAHLNQDDETLAPALGQVRNLTAFLRSRRSS